MGVISNQRNICNTPSNGSIGNCSARIDCFLLCRGCHDKNSAVCMHATHLGQSGSLFLLWKSNPVQTSSPWKDEFAKHTSATKSHFPFEIALEIMIVLCLCTVSPMSLALCWLLKLRQLISLHPLKHCTNTNFPPISSFSCMLLVFSYLKEKISRASKHPTDRMIFALDVTWTGMMMSMIWDASQPDIITAMTLW